MQGDFYQNEVSLGGSPTINVILMGACLTFLKFFFAAQVGLSGVVSVCS